MCESRMVKPTRNCDQCGTSFVSKQPKKHRFCCKRCADAWSQANAPRKRHATCQHCGEGFHPKASNRQSFCTRQCARAARSIKQIAERQERKEANRLRLLFERLKLCVVCNAAFIASQKSQVACSYECRHKHQYHSRIRQAGYDPNHKPCLICGLDVGPAIPKQKRDHYCQQCQAEARKATRRKARHKREGRLSVTSKDSMKTKQTIYEIGRFIAAAGNSCPCCGLLMARTADKSSDRALELDHALPISRGGEDEWPNIRPLCRKCNGFKSDFTSPDIIISTWVDSSEQHITIPPIGVGA